MTKRPWFKFYGSDFRDGVAVLTLEEVGAYTILLTRMYESESGSINDDDRVIAWWLKSDRRVWKRIKTRLVATGKIIVAGGLISNDRVRRGITSAELPADLSGTSAELPPNLDPHLFDKPLNEIGSAEKRGEISETHQNQNQKPDYGDGGGVAREAPPAENQNQDEDRQAGNVIDLQDRIAAFARTEAKTTAQRLIEDAAIPALTGIGDSAVPQAWIDAGYAYELVLDVVRKLSAKSATPIRTWGYFTRAIERAEQQRRRHLAAIQAPSDAPPDGVRRPLSRKETSAERGARLAAELEARAAKREAV